jgi:uncharacterized MAPEG superfamily protein
VKNSEAFANIRRKNARQKAYERSLIFDAEAIIKDIMAGNTSEEVSLRAKDFFQKCHQLKTSLKAQPPLEP